MDRKLFQCKDVKIDDEGKITLVFGTMNVIDHDNDVTLPGAIGEPQKVRMSAYNHSSWGNALPVGKGVAYEKGDDMIFEGRFFMTTENGKETHATVKEMGDLQEYSYGFDILEAGWGKFEDKDVRFLKGLKIYEVSPVLLGAGIDTRTLAVKGQGGGDDETYTRMLRRYSKAAMDQIDRVILGEEGKAAMAKIESLIQDDLILNGTGGGIDDLGTIDVGEINTRHLIGDLSIVDAKGNRIHDLPEGAKSKTYAEHAELLLQAVEDFVKRSQSIADLRAEKGKDPASDQNKGRLIDIAKALTEAADGLLDFTMDEDAEVATEAALLLEQHDTRNLIRG